MLCAGKTTSHLGYGTFSTLCFYCTTLHHFLSPPLCKIVCFLAPVYAQMTVTEVLIIKRAKVESFFFLTLFISVFLPSFSLSPSLAGYVSANVTVSDDKFSSHFIPFSHFFLSCVGSSYSTFCIILNMHYGVLSFLLFLSAQNFRRSLQ